MKITKVICSKGRTGFFFDDQRAIKKGAAADGAAYVGDPAIALRFSIPVPAAVIRCFWQRISSR